MEHATIGFLAEQIGKELPLTVLRSSAGYYIGTVEDGLPCSRESVEYFESLPDAEYALQHGTWTQKYTP